MAYGSHISSPVFDIKNVIANRTGLLQGLHERLLRVSMECVLARVLHRIPSYIYSSGGNIGDIPATPQDALTQ